MSNASISGLGSGLDTTAIVSQLMQLEAVQQNKLKSRVSSEQSSLTVLQGLNTKVAALGTSAKDMGGADAWSSLSTTSSSEGVSVTATTGTSATDVSVTVKTLAQAHSVTFTDAAALDDVVVDVDPDSGKRLLTLTRPDGTSTTLDTGDGTLRSVVAALNTTSEGEAGESGVRATTIQTSPGVHRLVVDSATSGADSGFTLTLGDGSGAGAPFMGGEEAARTRTGSDATIEVAGFTLTSATNTFDEVMPGISITLTAKAEIDETVQLSVTRDASVQSTAVKKLIDDLNAVLKDLDTHTGYHATTKAPGALAGDSGARTVRNDLLQALYPGDGTTMATFGVEVDRYGRFTFDEEKFAAALADDPQGVAAAFSAEDGGFASRVTAAAEAASDKYAGTLSTAIQSRTDGITRLNESIASWDKRLELRQNTLTRQFTALDVALSRMNSQSSWLSSQLSSLG